MFKEKEMRIEMEDEKLKKEEEKKLRREMENLRKMGKINKMEKKMIEGMVKRG